MRRVFWLLLSFWGAVAAPGARIYEITRACLPGFCIESAAAFTVVARDPARGRYRLLFSRDQAVLYLQTGEPPPLPHCGALCALREEEGEMRVYHNRTGRLMGRLIGPLEGCGVERAFHVYAYVYFSAASPAAIHIERHCPDSSIGRT